MKPTRITRWAAYAVGSAALVLTPLALAGSASAAPLTPHASFPAVLSSSGTGASAVWNGTDSVKLTVGTPSSSTFAQAKLVGAPTFLPSHEPSFTTDNYAAGSPRWVISLDNGKNLFVYPTGTGQFSPASTNVEISPAITGDPEYVSWSTALTEINGTAGSHVVSSAYIVADGDQTAGTTDTIDNVLYDGRIIAPVHVPPHFHVQAHGHVQSEQSHKYLAVLNGKLVQENLGDAGQFAMVINTSTNATGLEVLTSLGHLSGKFVVIPDSGQATVVNHFAVTSKHGAVYYNTQTASPSSHVLNNAQFSLANGNRQIGWLRGAGSSNENYTSPTP